MKKIWNKIESNKLLFAIFMIISLLIFIYITNGFHGIFGYQGILSYFASLVNTTENGLSMVVEICWALCLIPVILIFKNKYIFSQKSKPFKEIIKNIWPMVITTTAVFIEGFISNGGFKYININEIVAMLILYTFVGIFEEFLCRGWLLNEFKERFGNNRSGLIFSIILSGTIFGLIHSMNILVGQSVYQTIIQIFFAALIGILYGSIYLKTNNIWTVIFLHGYWDFAVSIAEMNNTTTCFASQTIDWNIAVGLLVVFIGIIFQTIMQLPAIIVAIKNLTKTSTNEMLKEENKIALSEQTIKTDKTINKVLNIINIIVVTIYCIVALAITKPYTPDACILYETITTKNAEITTLRYFTKEIELTKEETINKCLINDETKELKCTQAITGVSHQYKLSFDQENFIVEDLNDNQTYKVELANIAKFAAYEEDDKYYITILVDAEDGYYVYYSDYLSLANLSNPNFATEFTSSFTKLDLPSIITLGYYTSDSHKYPLFIDQYDTYYVKFNDGIKKVTLE